VPTDHRTVPATSLYCRGIRRPFSNFDFIDKTFPNAPAIRRIFSLGRAFEARSLVIEDLCPSGLIADENAELLAMFPDYTMPDLKRVSFWRTACEVAD